MWRTLSISLISSIVALYACIPTESPDDRPDIPGVFTTTTLATTSTVPITTTTTPTTTTSTSTTTTSTSTTTTTTSTTTTTTTSLLCPTNYNLFTDPNLLTSACYFVSPLANKLNWFDARIACMADGGDLAVIHTQEENDFVLGLALPDAPAVGDIFTEMIWLGVRCDTGCGGGAGWTPANYMNIDGSPFDFHPMWLMTVPQPDAGVNSCLSLMTNNGLFGPASVGSWHDLDCNAFATRYACEVPVTPVG